jgi:hypothetical protein
MAIPKYRPSFSAPEVRYILTLLRNEPSSEIRDTLLRQIQLLSIKISENIAEPSYIKTTPTKVSLDSAFSVDSETLRYQNGEMSPEEMKAFENKLLGI